MKSGGTIWRMNRKNSYVFNRQHFTHSRSPSPYKRKQDLMKIEYTKPRVFTSNKTSIRLAVLAQRSGVTNSQTGHHARISGVYCYYYYDASPKKSTDPTNKYAD